MVESTRSRDWWRWQVLYLVALFFSCCCILQSSQARDMLRYGESLKDGETLVSEGGIFELGFFSPGKSKNRYVGIWYKKDPLQTPVWVANREYPVKDSSGILGFDSSCNLMIFQTGESIKIVLSAINVSLEIEFYLNAQLLDDGNLIIQDHYHNREIWQSFNHTSHTLLPGMYLSMNWLSGQQQSLISWASPQDPAPGNFSFGFSSANTRLLETRKRDQIYWRSGFWKRQISETAPALGPTDIYTFDFSDEFLGFDHRNSFFTYYLKNASIISRLVLDVYGQLTLLIWSEESHHWLSLWSEPKNLCQPRCGAFSICDPRNLPFCRCLYGFKPVSAEEWSRGDFSSGCMRKTHLQCQENSSAVRRFDGFLTISNVQGPVNFQSRPNFDTRECELACYSDCSCTAFSYGPVSCHLWYGDLLNLQQRSSNSADGVDLHIRLAASELRISRGNWHRLIKVIPIVLSILITGTFIWLLFRRKLRRKEKETSEGAFLSELSKNIAAANKIRRAFKHTGDGTKLPQFQLFSFSRIAIATDNFSSMNKLGEGGFGPVYKGKLPDGQEIAVKRLSTSSRQGLEEFKNEVILISQLHHKNLVSLLGCCMHKEEKLLVYEYMPNKSLRSYLFDETKRTGLDWGKRVKIIHGIVEGLHYLHGYSGSTIIHRDLKASNILLDDAMNPKISDFGLARIFEGDEVQASTKRVVGTYGYMPPEYTMRGLFSQKTDVFSFGVLLLEIICGKKNAIFNHSDHALNLPGYAWELWKDGRGVELFDPLLATSFPMSELMKYIHVALLCVQEIAHERPTMSDVGSMIREEDSILPAPNNPSFYVGRRKVNVDLPVNDLRISVNNVTLSTMEGR